jgi:hypothetical protein
MLRSIPRGGTVVASRSGQWRAPSPLRAHWPASSGGGSLLEKPPELPHTTSFAWSLLHRESTATEVLLSMQPPPLTTSRRAPRLPPPPPLHPFVGLLKDAGANCRRMCDGLPTLLETSVFYATRSVSLLGTKEALDLAPLVPSPNLLSLYLSVKRSHHVRREGLEIPTLIQKREEYTPLDFMKIWRSILIKEYINSELK